MTREVAYAVVVGQILTQLRKGRQIPQAWFADRLHMAQHTLSRLEAGKLPLTVETLARWSMFLEMQPHEILRDVHDAIAKLELYGVAVVYRRPERGDVNAAAISAPLVSSSPRAARAERVRIR